MADLCISIHGHSFPILLDALGVEHVKVKDLCEPFELNVQAQTRRLEDAPWATLAKIASVRSSGKRTNFWCLPLRRVVMFFATLSPGHVSEAFRPILIAMQNEVSDAIDDYYRKGGAIRTSSTMAQLLELQEQIQALIRDIPLEDSIWPSEFVRQYAKWHHLSWQEGERQPFSMKAANWFFYEMIFPAHVLAVIRDKGLEAGARYHQILTDGPRDYVVRKLEVATVLALDCPTEKVWRDRMRRAFKKTKGHLRGQRELNI